MKWEAFKEFKDIGSAQVVSQYLESEGVPAHVQESGLDSGVIASYLVFVSAELAHRARWVLAQSDFTESELGYLATGKLSDEKN